MQKSKILNIPYNNQVHTQITIQSQDPNWQEPFWYLCGPASINMVLVYFGLANTLASTTKIIAENILVDPNNNDGRLTDWMKMVTYLEEEFKITSEFITTTLTFADIQQKINAGLPILTSFSFTLPPDEKGETKLIGHIVTIIGYATPDIVIINDPFGGKIIPNPVEENTYYHNWTHRNAQLSHDNSDGYGSQVKYTYSELSKILSNMWLSFTNVPNPSNAKA